MGGEYRDHDKGQQPHRFRDQEGALAKATRRGVRRLVAIFMRLRQSPHTAAYRVFT